MAEAMARLARIFRQMLADHKSRPLLTLRWRKDLNGAPQSLAIIFDYSFSYHVMITLPLTLAELLCANTRLFISWQNPSDSSRVTPIAVELLPCS
jgi:hypothetical protein